jgi:hypothetical protein
MLILSSWRPRSVDVVYVVGYDAALTSLCSFW